MYGNRVGRRQRRFVGERTGRECRGDITHVFLTDRRCTEARARSSADCKIVRQLEARGDLAVRGVAEGFVILDANRGIEQEAVGDVGLEVEIGRKAAAVEHTGILWLEAREAVRTDAEALRRQVALRIDEERIRIAVLDLELLNAVLQAECHIQRRREVAEVDFLDEVRIDVAFALDIATRNEATGHLQFLRSQLRVHRVGDEVFDSIAAVRRAEVVPEAIAPFTTGTARDRCIYNLATELRCKAARLQQVEGPAVGIRIDRSEPGRIGGVKTAVTRRIQKVYNRAGDAVIARAEREVSHEDGIAGAVIDAATCERVTEEEAALNFAFAPVTEDIGFAAVTEIQPGICPQAEMVANFRRSPDLRSRLTHGGVAGRNQCGRVVALNAAAGRVGFFPLTRHVEVTGIGQWQAPVEAHRGTGAVTFKGFAPAAFEQRAVRVVTQHKVDHTGDGVRAVLGRRAVAQDFDLLDGQAGDVGQVRSLRTVGDTAAQERNDRRAVHALAVDQHQRAVR